MPKSTDPTSLATSQSVNATRPSDILRAQLDKQTGVYRSSQIFDTQDARFYGSDVGSKLDELTGSLSDRPPTLGQTLTSKAVGSVLGIVDWGALKLADSAPWERNPQVTVGFDQLDSGWFKNPSEIAFPYHGSFHISGDGSGSDYRSDAIFNVGIQDNIPVASSSLPGAGAGSAHLSFEYKYQPSERPSEPLPMLRPVRLLSEGIGFINGITVSGTLFPADRGTIALIRTENGSGITPATSAQDILDRVVAAINLGQNLSQGVDGTPGGIFTEGVSSAFPSREQGQYDLSEIQRGTYRIDHPDLGGSPIAGLTADPHAGSVRLLRDVNAFPGADLHPGGNIPVLFGTEMWDHDTEDYFNYTGDQEEDLNFLAYRLPYLVSYAPEDLTTISTERGRFFLPIRPNSYAESALMSTAGEYGSFEATSYPLQIARFRYTVKYKQMRAGLETEVSDGRNNNSAYDVGSFALIHFKTENAFERLVRDGIMPDENDLYSVNLVGADLSDLDNPEIYVNGSALSNKGLVESLESFFDTGAHGSVIANNKVNNAFSKYGTFLRENVLLDPIGGNSGTYLRYMPISGVYHILPRLQSNPSSIFDSAEAGDDFETTALGILLRWEEINRPTNGDNISRNWADPFYGYSSLETNRDALSDPLPMATLPIARILFNGYTSGSSVLLEGESANNVEGYFLNDQLDRVSAGYLEVDYDTLHQANPFGTRADISRPLVLGLRRLYPLGDGGLEGERPPVFTNDLRLGLAVFSPSKHGEGLGLEKIESSADSQYNPNTELMQDNPYEKPVLYHSARMKSLIQDCVTDTVEIIANFNAVDKDALAFVLWRFDGSGVYGVAQTLDVNGTIFELCSGENNPYAGYYSTAYPIYRPIASTGYSGSEVGFSFTGVLNPTYKSHVAGGLGDGYMPFDSYHIHFVNRGQINSGDFTLKVNGYDHTDPSTFFDVVGSFNAGVTKDNGFDLKGFNSLSDVEYLDVSAWTTPTDPELDFSEKFRAVEVLQDLNDEMSHYGNFTMTETGAIKIVTDGSSLDIPYQAGFSARKDVSERFLDEMYRISLSFDGFDLVDVTSEQGNTITLATLLRSGNVLEHNGAPQTWETALDYTFRVRDDGYIYFDFDPVDLETPYHREAGWVRNKYHLVSLTDYLLPEAQVSALPYIPNATALSAYSSLSRGVLVVPEKDYETHRPSITSSDAVPQPDYSAGNTNYYVTASDGDLYSYLRMFDLGFNNNETVSSQFTIRLIGIIYSDLNTELYSVEDEAGLPFSEPDAPPFSVLIQLPAQTSWLNIARADEEGKSGGGNTGVITCMGRMISYENKVLVKESVPCVDITVSVDPFVPVQYSSFYPLLVKANVARTYDYQNCDFGSPFQENKPYLTRKGLVGIELIRPSNGLNYDGDEALPISDYPFLTNQL